VSGWLVSPASAVSFADCGGLSNLDPCSIPTSSIFIRVKPKQNQIPDGKRAAAEGAYCGW